MDNLVGIEYLKQKLARKQSRVNKRYKFYEMKNVIPDFGISTPPKLRAMRCTLGWCAKAVDSLADRLQFDQFENDMMGMNEIFQQNNADVLFDSAILSALISSCCFIYISADENGYPRLQVIDGANATGVLDPITGLLTEGYAVLDTDTKTKAPRIEAYFTSDYTEIYEKGSAPYQIPNPTGHPLLVPIIYRPDAKRPFGHSRISRTCMSLVESAGRTIKRSEIASEFYAFPQRYIVGLDDEVEIDKWQATMSSLLSIGKDKEGDKPTLGQFQQQTMTPYNEQLRMFASLFAGETGLTLDDLGFVQDNPSSAEAIKSSHENLRLTARKAQRTFGTGFMNVGYLARCLADNDSYTRLAIGDTKALWLPIFEPDSAMLSSIGDGIIKINQAIPGYFNTDNVRVITGIDPSKIETEPTTETE